MRFWLRLRNVFLVCFVAVVVCVSPAFALVDLDTTAPDNAPYTGGYWLSGYSVQLGNIDIFLSDNHGWCLDELGQLFRYANTSATGLMYTEDGTEYNFNAPAFSVPRYRLSSSSGYTYTDLYVAPTAGNIIVDTDFATPYDLQDMCAVFSCFMLAMLFVVKLLKKG